MNSLQLAERKIGQKMPPFIVAEMSANHNQSLERALRIVEEANRAGVDAVKIQTYPEETVTIDTDKAGFVVRDPNSPWVNRKLFDLYKEAHTPWEWHKPIMQKCRDLGLICFSTPLDSSVVDFLESLNVPFYKIGSFEIIDLPLIRRVAQTGKPMIISTGMASCAEIDEAVTTAKKSGCKEIVLLKCTSSYPASARDANLRTIPHMSDAFGCLVGLSDHTLGIGVAVAGVAMGAAIIEKHFTLSRNDGGLDATFSLEPDEMARLVCECISAWEALGTVKYGSTPWEGKSKAFRRSLYIVQDLKRGDILNVNNLKIIRPGYGLAPRFYDILIGKRVCRDVKKGTALTWELLFDEK
ncbi:MAG TPA: pseudaminic acid synthase [Atribacteraceae bacterium]|nr:pseudaminic acid synthase [Atribacteraceae bacterium]